MDIEQLKSMKTPFDVVDKDGNRHTIVGFKQNDPLGVGGGIFPDMPVAYFDGGGWLLVSDVLRHYEIAAEHSVHPTRGSVAQKGKSKSKKVAKPARG
jgi:hypothetical protein